MWSAGGAQLATNYSKDPFELKCKYDFMKYEMKVKTSVMNRM